MILINPFKRTKYLLRTTLTNAAAGSSQLKAADSHNQDARGRYLIVTTRDEQFSASVEPASIGQRGTSKRTSHFVIEATGQFLPSHDGTVQVTLAFDRSVSAGQLGWRLVFYLIEAAAAANFFWGPIVFVFGTSLAIILAVVGIPRSIVAYFQGMRRAGKDWTEILEVIRSSLYSQSVERA
jgi:hypothetical protein